MRSQQDKGRKVRHVKSVMRRCSHFYPLCNSVKDQVRLMYHKITPLVDNDFRIVDKQTDKLKAEQQIPKSNFIKLVYDPTEEHVISTRDFGRMVKICGQFGS